MAIGRVSALNRIKRLGYITCASEIDITQPQCLFVNTIHDSIILDVNHKVCDTNKIVDVLKQVFVDIPKNYEKVFGKEFNCPMEAEVQIGHSWDNLEVV